MFARRTGIATRLSQTWSGTWQCSQAVRSGVKREAVISKSPGNIRSLATRASYHREPHPSVRPRNLLAISLGFGAATILFMYLNDTRAGIYRWFAMPMVHALLDPEESHRLAIWLAKHGLVPKERTKDDDVLHTEIWGKTLSNPIGLAAGFDKNAEAVDALFDFGFGLVEIGSVTPLPQPGNPKPRMFRLPADTAVINRYGFNSDGHRAVEDRLKARIRNYLHHNRHLLGLQPTEGLAYPVTLPDSSRKSLREAKMLGVNLGKNKLSSAESNEDYIRGVKDLGAYADYLVVNISSPNTPGLRALQRREPIEKLMQEVQSARDESLPHHPPLLVKIAPDLNDQEIEDIAAVVKNVGVDGVIISNTTVSRPQSLRSGPKVTTETGGLSGPPVHPLSLAVVRKFYALTNGTIPIIGCGGVKSADEVLAFAKAGASLVQLYTAMAYEGPGLVAEIKDEVARKLKREGKRWQDIVGADHRK
ncbi:dihydroorotate oxidase [Spizellomyces punctatus DAOM BR117]|uniref:Dihydroorotate dehydrogenase (quinone), mitochondrial n=1 Tax=Spizellomyces punctatus (strain DAOM BR117) TaxID=645134 RepID=A0A0L0HU23_SPIPD|nr:dihydroorotate oxidase [Spizellomyces punctatus DAOM BR117]KND04856.1 dihydroorotate oxidase [Spizellomyces punctatus DAOM BR117]|eukprot:XP_016612895.1 dihydroorotate oxidase [Spizellomyces punctatus DAOM BR117]